MWTVYEMADRRAPRAVYKYWAQGWVLWLGRDQFDVCAYGLPEIVPWFYSVLIVWSTCLLRSCCVSDV